MTTDDEDRSTWPRKGKVIRRDELLGLIEEYRGPKGLDLRGAIFVGDAASDDPRENPVDLSPDALAPLTASRAQANEPSRPQWLSVAGINLRGAHLEGVVLRDAQLQGADLIGAQLQGADLLGARLQRAYLSDAHLQGADLSYAQLEEANLERAQLQEADLPDAQLQEANLSGAQLQGASLWGAQPQGASLWGAQLQGANLSGAQLQGAKLEHAQLQEADLRDAQLQGASLSAVQLQGADLTAAHLDGADLRGAQLQGANLGDDDDYPVAYAPGAALEKADLRWAQLEGARVSGTQLREADLREAQLARVDLYDICSLEGAHWYGAPLDHTRIKGESLGKVIGDEIEAHDKNSAHAYRDASEAYLLLKNNFNQIGRYEDASWAYVKEQQMEKMAHHWEWRSHGWNVWRAWGSFWRWLRNWAYELATGYGERPWNPVAWGGVIILGFAVGFTRAIGNFWDALIYSLATFATFNLTDTGPTGRGADVASSVEALLGISVLALVIFTLGNRMSRG